jgi:hypothetical protein
MSETHFRKGDRVQFQFVSRHVQGVVKEDRGPIGINGRRLCLISFPLESTSPTLAEIELPAESTQLVRESTSKA